MSTSRASSSDLQIDEWQQSSWRAVVAEHGRLDELLADSDRSVAAAALTVLAWTEADSVRLWAAIASELNSDDERDVASAWLASTVLGRLPTSVPAPVDLPRQCGTALRRCHRRSASRREERIAPRGRRVVLAVRHGRVRTGVDGLRVLDA